MLDARMLSHWQNLSFFFNYYDFGTSGMAGTKAEFKVRRRLHLWRIHAQTNTMNVAVIGNKTKMATNSATILAGSLSLKKLGLVFSRSS